MSVNKIVVEDLKESFQAKSNDELYEIIREERQDDWFEEKKLAAETILKNRENIDAETILKNRENIDVETILKNRENITKKSNETINKKQNKPNKSLRFPSPDLGYVSSYGTARGLSSLVVGLGWIVVAIGVVISVLLFSSLMNSGMGIYGIASVASGIGTIFGGLVMVMSGQITKATLYSADNTGRILHMFRKLSD